MADKAISDLNAASTIKSTDLFVLQQDNTAKKLTGQTLINELLKALDGHGGIQSVEKVSTSGLADTYRLTFADTTTFDIVVTNGRGINSITKTGTSGLTDTYTISYNDGTSKTFTVKNGRAISKVSQTSASGLTRTYTISFNDGTSETFTVTDGRSISSIAQTSASGLTRTYTISFNDGSTETFTVTDGRGISSFVKTSTSGLVDSYTITYNDGTTTTFTVTNGAKGDKGDNAYTHIKWASQEPTEASHSMGDVPDAWMGVYSGTSATAPTDWAQYKWYKIKGDKGDPGDAAILLSRAVEYQTSDSGTIIPSGAWSTSIPVVAQGKYMWTRTTLTFNSGDPVVSYSVARMGIDGAGSISSVNDVSPDSDGNVTLTAEDIGALPSTGGDMTGALNMNGQQLSGLNSPSADSDAATKGYVDNVTYTYTQASTLANLTSGEKLTVSLGKIMKAIADLIAHLANNSNPHKVTADQLTSGTLSSDRLPTVPIAKGGTGATTASAARTNLGVAAASHTHAASDVTSGTLSSDRLPTVPISKGGTGATTAANALTNLGASPASHNHNNAQISPAAIELTPGSGAGHGGYIDFHYNGSTADYTSRIIESANGNVALNDQKILTAANITAIYSVTVEFSEGKATYSHSAIKSTSVCIVQRRSSTPGSATTSMFATTSNSGSVTIVTDNTSVTTTNMNILILNL